MPRGKIAKQPKKKARAKRPPKYNRSLELTAADVLVNARLASHYGGPNVEIPSNAVIETKRVGVGFRYVIRWREEPTSGSQIIDSCAAMDAAGN